MTFIQTANGHLFDVLAPDTSKIEITDIAHALSNICRYTGHTGSFYSVAQHSVLASLHVTDAKYALAALMHDAGEAYLGDVSRPLKHILGKTYTDIEERLEKILAAKYGYEYPYPDCVKEIDNALLETEFKHLMGGKQFDLELGRLLEIPMLPWAPDRAERNFLERFDQLWAPQEFDFGPAFKKAMEGYQFSGSPYPSCYICGLWVKDAGAKGFNERGHYHLECAHGSR